MIQISGFMSIADLDLMEKIENILSEDTTIENKYEKVWESVDEETVNRLFFENQNIAKMFRQLVKESNLSNTGLMLEAFQNNPADIPLQERLENLPHNTLIITGVHDRNTGIPISKIINRNLPNSNGFCLIKALIFQNQRKPNILFVKYVVF